MPKFSSNSQRRMLSVAIVKGWKYSLVGMVAVFYAANIYDQVVAGRLFFFKWFMVVPLIVYSLIIARRVRRSRLAMAKLPSAKPILLVAGAFFFSVLDSVSVIDSALVYCSLLLGLSASYFLAIAIVQARFEREFFDSICVVGRSVIFSASLMWIMGLNLGRGSQDRFSAWTDNPNTLAMLLAPAIIILTTNVLARRKGWALRSLPFLAAGIFLMLMTGSRAGILWIFASYVGLYAYFKGIRIYSVLALVLLVAVAQYWDSVANFAFGLNTRDSVSRASGLLSGRSEVWPVGLELFSERPVFGHGIGASPELIASYQWLFLNHQGAHFHNSYLTAAVEAGSLGFVALIVSLLVAFVGGARGSDIMRKSENWQLNALPWAIVVGAMANGFFETTLLSAGNANMIIFWTCIVLLHKYAWTKSISHARGSPHRKQ